MYPTLDSFPLLRSRRMDLEWARDVAVRAAHRGGRVILDATTPTEAGAKGRPGDWVTEVDLASERAIAALLTQETPGIPLVGEESGGRSAERYWLVDPLDGTTNFMHGFPVIGVSVALVVEGRPAAGCVHAPFLAETFAVARGSGSYRWKGSGEDPPSVVEVADRSPAQAIVATGFPFRHKENLPRYLSVLGEALELFEDLRRPGAATLDLAWSASGIFDGFFELGLAPWDVAAGALLIEEAGGRVTDWTGGPDILSGDILAGSPAIHEALLQLVNRLRRS